MTIVMTKVEGVPDSSSAKPGMAHFEGSGPFDKTCGDCLHRGYRRQSSTPHWDERGQQEVYRFYSVQSCSEFKRLAGHHGAPVEKQYRACKYFEPAAKAK